MTESYERSAEEREAARLEREARRAARLEREQLQREAKLEREARSGAAVDDLPVWQPTHPRTDRRPRVPRAHMPRVGARRGEPGRTHSRRNRILAAVALVLALVIVWLCVETFQPFAGSGHGSVTVVIPPHSGVSAVADRLARAGVIGSSFFFELRATIDGDRGDLRAGTYHLKLGMSYGSVLGILTTAPPAAAVTNITITPGHTRRQLDALLRSQGIKGSYFADTRTSKLLNPSSYGAPRGTNSLEGFLFPDTYQLRQPVSIRALVADQLADFKRQFAAVNLGYAHGRHLSAYDVLIIASLIQAEASVPSDAARVASVIYNRLRDGIMLGFDSTVRYAVNNYSGPLTQAQLNSPSPFNTRNHFGLPPTPIDNPDVAAIQAAAHPANTNYLYFVSKSCSTNALAFASTASQFQSDVSRYNATLPKSGGGGPSGC